MCLFREAQCTPETQPGSTKRAFRALKIHSATAELAALGFQWINFIKKLLLRGNHSDTSGGNRTVLPYVLGSYIRSSSRGAQLRETQFLLIKRTFFLFPPSNPSNWSLGERWCFPLDWRDPPGCLSVFASGTTKGGRLCLSASRN